MNRAPIFPLVLGLVETVAHGQQSARIVHYHANDIVSIRAKMRHTTLIELPPTEKILEVATGDKDFWVIDAVGNYCFLHPAQAGTLRDPAVLREGEPLYTTLEHEALYAAWKMRSTNARKIRQRFMRHGPQAKFTTVALPYIYPLFSLKRERKTREEHGSRLRSGQRSLLEEA